MITLLGAPHHASSSYKRGAAEAPSVIREALRSPGGNSWSEALVDISRHDLVSDAGDLALKNDDGDRERIELAIGQIVKRRDQPLVLGGDHSITYPILRAVGPAHRGLTIVQVDAHPDLYPEFEGNRYSHACPFARIMEERLATRLVQVGIRAMSDAQVENVRRLGVEQIDMRAWDAGTRPDVTGPVYLSIDVDGIDPAFAPGVSHREPGGLSVRDVLTLIQTLPGPIVGADVVEFNPREDVSDLTAQVCAKLVKELIARLPR